MASRPTLDKYHSWSAYTLAKQGVITLTRAAAEESVCKGVNAYSICPSRVDTKFRDEVFPDEDTSTRLSAGETAEAIMYLFNGTLPNGEAYWIKKI
jgi:NAD(P)-dependent dehydrogenase (short-subunit alcohol dehydrogenase family)